MSRLPGAPLEEDEALGEHRLQAMADLLVTVHDQRPAEPFRTFQSWAWEEKWVVPPWSRHPDSWRHAFDLLAGPAPAYEPTFLHRDFHPGNVLWEGSVVSGVVDWVETSTGPATLDVAHCMTGLALLHGVDAAKRFAQHYQRTSGRAEPGSAYWWVTDVVGFLPGPQKVTVPWREAGRSIDNALAYQRLEAALESALAGLDSGEG